MLNLKAILVSKMTIHCAGSVQMREESESGIRKWEEMWFKTTAEDGEREGAAVTCDGRLFYRLAAATGNALSLTVDRRVRRTSRDVDEAERSRHLTSVSAGRCSSSHRSQDDTKWPWTDKLNLWWKFCEFSLYNKFIIELLKLNRLLFAPGGWCQQVCLCSCLMNCIVFATIKLTASLNFKKLQQI